MVSQPVGEIKVRRGFETYGGKGESLVKGVVVNWSAIALSVKPGGSIERVQILGGLVTHGLGVEALEQSRGGQESCGGGTCNSALGRMTVWVMCGRRPRCKKNLTFGLRSGASHVSGLFARHHDRWP